MGQVRGAESGVAWASAVVGSPVTRRRALTGGWTSTTLALDHADGTRTVLRLVDREPWLSAGAELVTREHETLLELERHRRIPAPRSLAVDPLGEHCEVPAHLSTFLSGTAEPTRSDDAALTAAVGLLVAIHDVVPRKPPRRFQSWAWEATYRVPDWAADAGTWEAAFALLRQADPAAAPASAEWTFLHRDCTFRNLLWGPGGAGSGRDSGAGAITGVVDWVETSTGPPWLDAAHAATHLALHHGEAPAQELLRRYAATTGRRPDPVVEVMDAVGLLPPPGRPGAVTDPAQRQRLEARVRAALADYERSR